MTAKKSSGAKKVASATTSRTGQVGAAETKVTKVEDANDKAAAETKSETKSSKEAPARKGHAVGYPRKSAEAKFGPKNPDIAEAARRQAAVGGI